MATRLCLCMCCREGSAAEPDAKRPRAEDGSSSQVQHPAPASAFQLHTRACCVQASCGRLPSSCYSLQATLARQLPPLLMMLPLLLLTMLTVTNKARSDLLSRRGARSGCRCRTPTCSGRRRPRSSAPPPPPCARCCPRCWTANYSSWRPLPVTCLPLCSVISGCVRLCQHKLMKSGWVIKAGHTASY